MTIVKLYKDMFDQQRQLIERNGFGGLLNFAFFQVHPELCNWLLTCFDAESLELVFPGRGSIPVIESSVHKVLGIPMAAEIIDCKLDLSSTTLMKQRFPILQGNQPKISHILEFLKGYKSANSKYLKLWTLLAASSLLVPPFSTKVSSRLYSAITDATAIGNKNWCELVFRVLREKLHSGSKKHGFKPCLTFLMEELEDQEDEFVDETEAEASQESEARQEFNASQEASHEEAEEEGTEEEIAQVQVVQSSGTESVEENADKDDQQHLNDGGPVSEVQGILGNQAEAHCQDETIEDEDNGQATFSSFIILAGPSQHTHAAKGNIDNVNLDHGQAQGKGDDVHKLHEINEAQGLNDVSNEAVGSDEARAADVSTQGSIGSYVSLCAPTQLTQGPTPINQDDHLGGATSLSDVSLSFQPMHSDTTYIDKVSIQDYESDLAKSVSKLKDLKSKGEVIVFKSGGSKDTKIQKVQTNNADGSSRSTTSSYMDNDVQQLHLWSVQPLDFDPPSFDLGISDMPSQEKASQEPIAAANIGLKLARPLRTRKLQLPHAAKSDWSTGIPESSVQTVPAIDIAGVLHAGSAATEATGANKFAPIFVGSEINVSTELKHWFVIVLNFKAQRFELMDSLRGEQDKNLLETSNKIISNIKILWKQHHAKSKIDISQFKSLYIDAPKQESTVDCGYYMLKYIEYWDGKTVPQIHQSDMYNIRVNYMSKMLHWKGNLMTWHQVIK
ncbi:unnamed protein product [Urochloa decumbens]|uniref:Ubiquitin-like protease family profile domain-containing protein n=1 Tax=Urochloa decumbens TaxID=240449 RepID=A0ABC9EXL4_9POAL